MKQFRGGVERTASEKVDKVKTAAWYSLNRRGVGGPLKTLILL